MKSKNLLKQKIKDAITLKFASGVKDQEIFEKLSGQIYYFITRKPGFTKSHISRGLRDYLTEENREYAILALADIYLDYIKEKEEIENKLDRSVKDILYASDNGNEIIKSILRDEKMIKRMRTSSCDHLYR